MSFISLGFSCVEDSVQQNPTMEVNTNALLAVRSDSDLYWSLTSLKSVICTATYSLEFIRLDLVHKLLIPQYILSLCALPISLG